MRVMRVMGTVLLTHSVLKGPSPLHAGVVNEAITEAGYRNVWAACYDLRRLWDAKETSWRPLLNFKNIVKGTVAGRVLQNNEEFRL